MLVTKNRNPAANLSVLRHLFSPLHRQEPRTTNRLQIPGLSISNSILVSSHSSHLDNTKTTSHATPVHPQLLQTGSIQPVLLILVPDLGSTGRLPAAVVQRRAHAIQVPLGLDQGEGPSASASEAGVHVHPAAREAGLSF